MKLGSPFAVHRLRALFAIVATSIPTRSGRSVVVGLLALAFLLGLPTKPAAHEIAADVTIRSFVKPEDGRLRFLVRVPLEAMRDFQWPLTGPGFLNLEEAAPMIRDAVQIWISDYVRFYENGESVGAGEIAAVRVSRPGNQSFDDYEQALAHVTGPGLESDVQLMWNQAMVDALLEYPIESPDSEFSLRPELAHLGLSTNTTLRFITPAGETRAYQYHGDPGLIRLDPRWYHAAMQFTESGIYHILIGLDHLLFLLCLVIPFRSLKGLIPVVTAFTVAHSITLIASALGMAPNTLWFTPFIETLIALSIVYMAFENMIGAKLHRRWLVTFGFGLIHGFGFSFVLAEQLQFAGSHLLTSLLAFNVGVEIGQILVLLAVVPALGLLFKYGLEERVGTLLLSALVAHTAWHWTTERGSDLLQYQFTLPAVNAAFMAAVLRWLMLALIVVGAGWLMWEVFARFELGRDDPDPRDRSMEGRVEVGAEVGAGD